MLRATNSTMKLKLFRNTETSPTCDGHETDPIPSDDFQHELANTETGTTVELMYQQLSYLNGYISQLHCLCFNGAHYNLNLKSKLSKHLEIPAAQHQFVVLTSVFLARVIAAVISIANYTTNTLIIIPKTLKMALAALR